MIRSSTNSQQPARRRKRFRQRRRGTAAITSLVAVILMLVSSQPSNAESRYNYDNQRYDSRGASAANDQNTSAPTTQTTTHEVHRTPRPTRTKYDECPTLCIVTFGCNQLRWLPTLRCGLEINVLVLVSDYDEPPNSVLKKCCLSAKNEMSLYRGYFVPGGMDPFGNMEIYTVDSSPKCEAPVKGGEEIWNFDVNGDAVLDSVTEAKNGGIYWGILVKLSDEEKKEVKKGNGGFLVFTIKRQFWKSACDGTNEEDLGESTSWMATAILVADGKVMMHHTNDRNQEKQYLQIINSQFGFDACDNIKRRTKVEVNVELLTRQNFFDAAHSERFTANTGGSVGGMIFDEVGYSSIERPWRKGVKRKQVAKSRATGDLTYGFCNGEFICDKSGSSGLAGSLSRPRSGTRVRGANPWEEN